MIGYQQSKQPIDGVLDPWYVGNLVFGGALGLLIIDPATGAMWQISEDEIDVELQQQEVSSIE